MNFLGTWFEDAKSVLTEPASFFSNENRRDGFGYPLKFAATSLVLAAVFSAIRNTVFSVALSSSPLVALVGTLVFTIVSGLVSLLLFSGIVHIFVYLLGGEKGYSSTLAAMGYALVVAPISALVSFVPILGALASLLITIYAVYIQIRGIEEFQSVSTGRAAVAVLLPAVILAVLAFILIMVAVLAGLAIGAGELSALA